MTLLLTKGYKQGRAVMFYDIAAIDGSCARQMVPKDEIVKMCGDGEIGNAKIQWWEGKAIVRCSDKNMPLVKVDESGNVSGEAHRTVKGTVVSHKNKQESAIKSKVVGKISKRVPKRDTSFDAYTHEKPVVKIHNMADGYAGIVTVEDLFDKIAGEFRVRQSDEYKKQFAKKIDISKNLSCFSTENKVTIQHAIATYLMNMVYDEVAEVYMKY